MKRRAPPPPKLHGDFILRQLQTYANAVEGLTFPVTIHSHGVIVTGTMISASLYYKLLAKDFETNIPDHVENVGSLIVDMFKKQSEILSSAKDPAISLHLQDAFIIQANDSGDFIPDGSEGMLWRGPLDSIDGFFFGRFLPPKPPHPELPFKEPPKAAPPQLPPGPPETKSKKKAK